MSKNKLVVLGITIIFVLLDLIVFKLFETQKYYQDIAVLVTFFVLVPFLYNKIILKRKLNSIGLTVGNWKQGLIWSIFLLVVSFLVFYVIAKYTPFLNKYNLNVQVSRDFFKFLFYEFGLVLFLSFVYEFFFRGFLMLYLKENFGRGSILIQWVVFLGLVFLGGEFSWNFLPYMVFSFLAGIITYKSNSIWYAWISQFILIFTMDVFFIKFLL